ncbi:MAG TPA: HAMP domain-containing protein, partial [Deltaproteobacteria bacterium]|nr:HAMP domain-containing protein [Deltaproteobacteria bacterium]
MRVQSIRVKINASIIAACIIVALFFGVVFSSFEIQRRASRIQEIGTLMEAVYEQNREELANEIFARHTEALASTLDAITSVKGICHIAVYDLEGRIIMATGKTVQRLMAQSTRKVLNRGPSVREVSISKEAYLEYASRIEVIGERVGYIAMYYDLTGLEEEGARTGMAFLALLVTTLVVLSLVLNRILTGAVLSPMTGLRQAIQKLQLGNLGEQVSVTSKDEIGEVMCAFNDFSVMLLEQRQALDHSLKMQKQYAKELEDANRMLEHLNVRLEDMVRERTRELLAANEQLKEQIAERRRSEKARKELDDRLARSEKMEALGLLAGGVAHDLNNVLSGIVSYPDLL